MIEIISAIFRIYRRISIYISDSSFISAHLRLYRRFLIYIGASPFISAIPHLYRRISIYISDSSFISAISHLYRRFPIYIGDFPFISTYRQKPTIKKRSLQQIFWNNLLFLCFYTRFSLYLFYNMPFLIPLYCTVIRVMIKRKPSIVFSTILHPLLLIFNRCHRIIIVCHYP